MPRNLRPAAHRVIVLGSILAAISWVAQAAATVPHDPRQGDETEIFYDFARVVDVEPVYRWVNVRTRSRVCDEAPMPRGRRHRLRGDGGSYTPAVVGGIVGGVVGNQFGKGKGKAAMTAAGALLGASVARDLQRRSRHGEVRRSKAHCWTDVTERRERRIDSYVVQYRYRGQTLTTNADTHPGDRIRVRVYVAPADDEQLDLSYVGGEHHGD